MLYYLQDYCGPCTLEKADRVLCLDNLADTVEDTCVNRLGDPDLHDEAKLHELKRMRGVRGE